MAAIHYRYPPGQVPDMWTPGDVLLTRSSGVVGAAIRFGQRLHYRGTQRQFCWTNHAALVVSTTGQLIESLAHGPVVTDGRRYQPKDFFVVSPSLAPDARKRACDAARALLGDGYGWIDIASIALSLISGRRIHLPHDHDDIICSAAVATELAAAGLEVAPTSALPWVMPADLAVFFDVTAH